MLHPCQHAHSAFHFTRRPFWLPCSAGRHAAPGQANGASKAALQDLGLRIEPNQLTHPLALPLTGSLGNQADNLAFDRLGLVAARQR